MSSLAELKRTAAKAAAAFDSCPDRLQVQNQIAEQERLVESLNTMARHADLAEEHGGTYPRPDPQKAADAKARLLALQQSEPVADMRHQLCRNDAHQTDLDFRRAASAAIRSGPGEDAQKEFQEAFQLMWNKGLALAGHEHAAGQLTGQDRYGPVEALFKKINDLMWRDHPAHELRPSWMPLSDIRFRTSDGVTKAEASALAWLEQEIGA